MVAHTVLPLKALLTDGTGERLLIRVGQAVAVEMVNVTERFSTCFTGVVLSHWIRVGICRPLRNTLQSLDLTGKRMWGYRYFCIVFTYCLNHATTQTF